MPAGSRSSSARRDNYSRQTLRPLNCLVFILPLLLFFQIGTAYYGTALFAPRDLHKLLRYFGATAAYLPVVLIVAVLLTQHLARRDPWQVRPKALAGMFAESMVWAAPLVAMNYLTGLLPAAAAEPGAENALRQILTSVGAGIYEEFIFRLIFISLIMLIFVDVFELRKDVVAVLTVIVSAVLFGLYHFSGAQLLGGQGFSWPRLLFFTTAGVYLGGLFVFRGFGVAVGAHAAYNIYVFVCAS